MHFLKEIDSISKYLRNVYTCTQLTSQQSSLQQ